MLTFDTHEYVKELQSVGFTEQQAEVQAKALNKIIDINLVTKHDLNDAKQEIKQEIKELEIKLTVRMGIMLTIGISVTATLVKLL